MNSLNHPHGGGKGIIHTWKDKLNLNTTKSIWTIRTWSDFRSGPVFGCKYIFTNDFILFYFLFSLLQYIKQKASSIKSLNAVKKYIYMHLLTVRYCCCLRFFFHAFVKQCQHLFHFVYGNPGGQILPLLQSKHTGKWPLLYFIQLYILFDGGWPNCCFFFPSLSCLGSVWSIWIRLGLFASFKQQK